MLNNHVETVKLLRPEYATFRHYVIKFFKEHLPKEPTTILDPMAGTAPLIPFVETHGHTAYFNDILPIHTFINNAKTYSAFECFRKRGYDWFYKQLLRCMKSLQGKRLCISDKLIDDSILENLVNSWYIAQRLDEDVASLLKAAIILSVRDFASITRTQNPTWFKCGGISSNKELPEIISDALNRLDQYYRLNYDEKTNIAKGQCFFSFQDAAEFCTPKPVDFIVTSPPYCNRLDYKVKYAPENYFLSAIGYSITETNLIGTTKVKDYDTFEADFSYLTKTSKFANKLLNEISRSSKRQESMYYPRYYTHYFTILSKTFLAALRNLSAKGVMYVITQDNGHRGHIIEMDKILKEILASQGWKSRIIKKTEHHHLGLRNISRDKAFVKPRQFEKIILVKR